MTSLPRQLPLPVTRALADRGHTSLKPVQQAVLDALPAQGDLLVSAPPGSGKTVAFGIALAIVLGDVLCAVVSGVAPCGLVITPTRELAQQVCSELAWLLAQTRLRPVCVTGGASELSERASLQGSCTIVVGTPGRLSAHVAAGALDLGQCRMVVIDEADEMLALGFRGELDALMALPRGGARVMLVSATVPPEVEQVAQRYQKRQLRLDLQGTSQGGACFDLRAVEIAARDRTAALVNLLRFHNPRAAVIFCNRRATVAGLAARLETLGFRVAALSGALPQPERRAALEAMRSGVAEVCVATDVAARGLDLPRLDLVLHAEVPGSPQALLHRSGRSGRSDHRGRSVVLATARERRRIEELARGADLALTWDPAPGPEAVRARDIEAIGVDRCFHDPPDDELLRLARALGARHSPLALALACARLWRSGRPEPHEYAAAPGPEISGLWFEIPVGGEDVGRMGQVLRRIVQFAGVPRTAIGRVHAGAERIRFEVSEEAGARLRAAGDNVPAALRAVSAPRRTTRRQVR